MKTFYYINALQEITERYLVFQNGSVNMQTQWPCINDKKTRNTISIFSFKFQVNGMLVHQNKSHFRFHEPKSKFVSQFSWKTGNNFKN